MESSGIQPAETLAETFDSGIVLNGLVDKTPGQSVALPARTELLGSEISDRRLLAKLLQSEIKAMNPTNFLVRPHRENVNRYRETDPWNTISIDELAKLRTLGNLPRELDPEHEDAKRFDLLVLSAQLAVLNDNGIERQQKRIQDIAALLQEKDNILQVEAEMELICDVQSDYWWEDVTYQMLETLRTQLRMLVTLLDKTQRPVIYIDLEDAIGRSEPVDVIPAAESFEQLRKKAEHFLQQNLGEAVVAKVRSGEPLTSADIDDLQRLLVAADIGNDDTFKQASEPAGSFGLFIRSIVGLDRAAAKAAFNTFLTARNYTATQIDFVNLIIDELTRNGALETKRLYQSPYKGIAPQGPETLFTDAEIDELIASIESLVQAAATA